MQACIAVFCATVCYTIETSSYPVREIDCIYVYARFEVIVMCPYYLQEIQALNKLNDEQQKILASKEGRINRRLQEFDRENSRRHEDLNEPSTKL